MEPLVILLHDRRVAAAERLDLLGHGAAAAGLASAAFGALPARTPGGAALAAVEIAAALGLALAIRRELRARDEERPARVSWLNLAAAAVLGIQWYVERRAGGKLFSPELLSALVTAGLAFLHPLVQRRRRERRALRMDGAGISIQIGRLRRFTAAWSDLRAVDAAPAELRFVRADGREHRVSLRAITNRDEVAAAVATAAERMGIRRIETTAPPPSG
jgi:hypothetical protein